MGEEEICPTKEEKDAYIEAREIYIAIKILYNIGYEDFVKRVKLSNLNWLLDKYYPCEGNGGQCKIDCPIFGNENCENKLKEKESQFIFFPKMNKTIKIKN